MITVKDKYHSIRGDKYLNGYFKKDIKWAIDCSNCDGLLVQRIVRETNSSPRDIDVIKADYEAYNHAYYEYWKITCGETDTKFGSDDTWSYGNYLGEGVNKLLADCIKKYKTKAEIKMTGTLYFVPEKHSRYNDITSSFKKGQVRYAGNLPSIRSIDYEDELTQIWTHYYEHQWDLSTDILLFNAVKECLDIYKIKIALDDYRNTPIQDDIMEYLFSKK